MNENLKKLAMQADVYCDQHWFGHDFYNLHWEEKFAELIVRECMRVVEDYYMDPCSYADEAIKEHFGVENGN